MLTLKEYTELQNKLEKELELKDATFYEFTNHKEQIKFLIRNDEVIILNGTYTTREISAISSRCPKYFMCNEIFPLCGEDDESYGQYWFKDGENPKDVFFIRDKSLNHFSKPYNPIELKEAAQRWYREYTILYDQKVRIAETAEIRGDKIRMLLKKAYELKKELEKLKNSNLNQH